MSGPKRKFRLVSKERLLKSGVLRTSSSSDGVVDVVAGLELGDALGGVLDTGLVALLPKRTRQQAHRLLEHNTLWLLKPKEKTLAGLHQKATARDLVLRALPKVIGPLYWEEKQKKGIGLVQAMDRRRVADWIKAGIETPGSELNQALQDSPFNDLCELNRGWDWWYPRPTRPPSCLR